MISKTLPVLLSGLSQSMRPVLLAFGLLALPLAAVAQDASSSQPAASSAEPSPLPPQPKMGDTVATVGGEAITEADLAFAAEDLGQDLQQVPPDQIRAVLLSQMIDMKLMAQAGEKLGLSDDELFKLRLSYLTDRAMRRAYAKKAIGDTITPDMIKAEYDKQIAAIPAQDEVHARHILVNTEDDAKAIKAQLDGGADFATLAKDKSIDPSAKQNGGDLGFFTADKMVKPFADAAFAMKVNEISAPVQSQFGWHVIQVLERRPAPKPTLEELSGQISQQLYVQKYRELFGSLRSAATIDIPDAELKAAVEAQLGPAQ